MALIVDCKSCGRKLRIPDELLGQKVKCPTCGETFDAQANGAAEPPPAPPPAVEAPPAAAPPPPAPEPAVSKPRSAGYGFLEIGEEHTEPKPPSERPIATPTEPPSDIRRRDDDEDDDDEDYRPWEGKRRGLQRRDVEPHRGTLVLVLGIVSIVLSVLLGPLGLALGIPAWIMGHRDLNRMKRDEMDRDGQGQTQAGWICGIVGTCLGAIYGLCCGAYIGFMVFAVNNMQQQQRGRPVGAQQQTISTSRR